MATELDLTTITIDSSLTSVTTAVKSKKISRYNIENVNNGYRQPDHPVIALMKERRAEESVYGQRNDQSKLGLVISELGKFRGYALRAQIQTLEDLGFGEVRDELYQGDTKWVFRAVEDGCTHLLVILDEPIYDLSETDPFYTRLREGEIDYTNKRPYVATLSPYGIGAPSFWERRTKNFSRVMTQVSRITSNRFGD